MKKILLTSLFFFMCSLPSNLPAQIHADTLHSFSQQDTAGKLLRTDTAKSTSVGFVDDTTFAPHRDSIIFVLPIPELGAIEPFGDTVRNIPDSKITWQEYRSLYDILSTQQGLFVRDLASPGQQNQIIAGGLTDRNIAIMVDGIPYNDYFTGSYNLWLLPVDAIERIEYISGAGSIFYDGKSAGGVINIITKNYFNNRAVTRLRYSQGVDGYVHTDALFTQNVLRNVNLTLGLTHYGYGSNKETKNYRGRFSNSNDNAWTFRTKLRYNITDWIDISFFYLYNKTWTGLHGGINSFNVDTIFNELIAPVRNSDSYEKYSNQQYTVAAAFYPFADSTLLASLSLYGLDRLREYRDEENRSVRNGIYNAVNYRSYTSGAKFQLNLTTGFNDIYYYTLYRQVKKQNEITVGIKDKLKVQPFFSVTPFLTVISKSGSANINAGALGEFSLTQAFRIFGGVSENLVRDNSAATDDIYAPQAEVGNPEKFSTKEIGISIISGDRLFSKLSFQQTNVAQPVFFDTIQISTPSLLVVKNNYTYNALSASAHIAIGKFHFEGTGNYFTRPSLVRNNVDIALFPKITLDGSAYFRGLLANGHLDLKIGIRGRYFSEQTGMAPYDEYGVWLPSSLLRYGPSAVVDFFAIGKIGDAYVHVIWENLTNSGYLLAPVYPMYNRNIRFGISWEFLD